MTDLNGAVLPPLKPECNAPMPASILRFIARRTQVRLRQVHQVAQFVNRYGQFVQPGPTDVARLATEQLEHEQRDHDWNRRHGPIPGGAQVVRFPQHHQPSPATNVGTRGGDGG